MACAGSGGNSMNKARGYLGVTVPAVLLGGSAIPVEADPAFDSWMKTFEAAKQKQDYPACESALTEALKHGSSEYAVGSLVWAQMNELKTEQALDNAHRMIREYGSTPYAVGSLMDA